MIDPKDTLVAIKVLKIRIETKKELLKFTQMEIEELQRTIEKMEKQ